MVLSGQALNALVEQRLFNAELIEPVVAPLVWLPPGPNCWVAEIIGLVHAEKPELLFSVLRNDEQPSLIPVGISGLDEEDAPAAEDVDD